MRTQGALNFSPTPGVNIEPAIRCPHNKCITLFPLLLACLYVSASWNGAKLPTNARSATPDFIRSRQSRSIGGVLTGAHLRFVVLPRFLQCCIPLSYNNDQYANKIHSAVRRYGLWRSWRSGPITLLRRTTVPPNVFFVFFAGKNASLGGTYMTHMERDGNVYLSSLGCVWGPILEY